MSATAQLEINNHYSDWVKRALPAYDAANEPNFIDKNGEIIEGIYLDLPNDVYHSLPAYSSSQLKKFFESPAHYYREYLSNENRKRTLQTKRTFDTGTLAHELCLEPEQFYNRYFRDLMPSDLPDAIHTLDDLNTALKKAGQPAAEGKKERLARLHRLVPETKDNQYKTIAAIEEALFENGFPKTETKLDKARRLMSVDPNAQVFDFLQHANRAKQGEETTGINEHGDRISIFGGKLPIDGLVWDDAFRAFDTVRSNVEACGHLSYGLPEVAMFVRCPSTKLLLKAKFDWLSFYDTATDVKTTLSASPDKFRQKIGDLHYCLQDSFYTYVSSLLGINISTFTFVAVEFMHANICQSYQLSESRRKKSQIQLANTLANFQWCLENNKWYGYQRDDCTIILD